MSYDFENELLLVINNLFYLIISFIGNLALSRALGDFVFKKNEKKPPEEQIVTGIYV